MSTIVEAIAEVECPITREWLRRHFQRAMSVKITPSVTYTQSTSAITGARWSGLVKDLEFFVSGPRKGLPKSGPSLEALRAAGIVTDRRTTTTYIHGLNPADYECENPFDWRDENTTWATPVDPTSVDMGDC